MNNTIDNRLNTPRLLSNLIASSPESSRRSTYQRVVLGRAYQGTLDRVSVLGDDTTGHTGCVNALSWAMDGEILVTGGDDTTVRLWRLDSNDPETPYPFKCDAVVQTGHRGNIFNAQFLPSSSRIATVARDKQVRIFDVERAISAPSQGLETEFTREQTCIRVLRCHADSTKRIVTEESPDLFLTVSEDGTVRQHDLRTNHRCSAGTCPPPLVTLPHPLSSLALSPLTPYQFVVAGEAPHGYLFDRRQLRAGWRMSAGTDDFVNCVRRFGRRKRGPGEVRGGEHITGARVSRSNGHEVLLSYSSDAVYLYSTRDEPRTAPGSQSPVLAPNNKKRKLESRRGTDAFSGPPYPETGVPTADDTNPDEAMDLASEDEEDGEEDEDAESALNDKFKAPLIMPRNRYAGACNVRTVKDVNFLGPDDEYVASGSDDGNFFLWHKSSGDLHGVYEGDGTVVNVIESHPRLPLVAVSGIDTTVKLFAPSNDTSHFSRMENAQGIMWNNVNTTCRYRARSNYGISLRYLHWLRSREILSGVGEDDELNPPCTPQ